jgi:pilus assembly protein Flp/PilA
VAADDDLIQRPPFSKKQFNKTQETGKMKNLFRKLWKDEEGQDLVEYALLVVLVALGAVAAMTNLASGISDAFSNAVAQLTTT